MGVERAQAHCARLDRAFAVTRSVIGNRDYTIAFRCPRPEEARQEEASQAAPTVVEPPRGWEPGGSPPRSATGTNAAPTLY